MAWVMQSMESGLDSSAAPMRRGFRTSLIILTMIAAPRLSAQDDAASPVAPAAVTTAMAPAEPQFNLSATIAREKSDQVRLHNCRAETDAGTISGEIVVCREVGSEDTELSGDREETRKRYALETMLKGAPRAPDFIIDCHEQGYPFGCVAFGKVPPPAYSVDFDALPIAPAGSEADRIARGLSPVGSEDQP